MAPLRPEPHAGLRPGLRPDPRQGAVLIMTLLLLLAAVSMVFHFSSLTLRQATEARFLAAEYQADLLAESVLEIARTRLADDDNLTYDSPDDKWSKRVQEDNWTLRITPCNALINANALLDDERMQTAVETLLRDKSHPLTLLDNLLDWVDDELSERNFGSENLLYSRRWPPYRPRNADLETPEELLLVHGWDAVPRNWLESHFTAWSKDNVNINFVPEDIFKALLPELANQWDVIDAWRRDKGFQSKADLQEAMPFLRDDLNLWNEVIAAVAVKSTYFQAVIEVRLPFVYEKRRYLLYRAPLLLSRAPQVIRGDVLAVRPTAD